MNLSINNINFQGRKESVYAVKKAAEEAKKISLYHKCCSGPRPMNKDREINLSKGAIDAYLDMFVKDDTFESSLKEIVNDKEIITELKSTLAALEVHSSLKLLPYNHFAQPLKQIVEKSKEGMKNDVDTFLKMIKS